MSIAWQRVGVVSLLIIQTREWMNNNKNKSFSKHSFYSAHIKCIKPFNCLYWSQWCKCVNRLKCFTFQSTGNDARETDKWLECYWNKHRDSRSPGDFSLSFFQESHDHKSFLRVCVCMPELDRFAFDPIVRSRDCCVMTNTLTTISLMSIRIQTTNPNG